MATLTELIRQEDPKRPYTDEQLAQMLQLRREQVVELRRINGIPNSWMRLRPALVVEMQKLLEQEPGLSDRSLTLRLNAMGYNVSRYLVKELHSNLPEKEAEPQPEPAVEITTQEETEGTNVFAGMIGYDGGLKAQIHQAKAAVSYPPNGLHTLIIGPSGSGKTFLAENMYHYAVQQGLLAPDAPFVSFNCADYADNPQLLNSQLFGYVRGAFSGANATKDGLVQKADGGILFLDEIHRLSGEGQEMLFYLLDKGSYRRLGDSGPARKVNVRLIAATTSSPESALLLTFRRRIPIVISMPGIADRPMAERFAVLQSIFAGEYKKIDRKLVVEREAVRILLQYDCPGNIGQMQSDNAIGFSMGWDEPNERVLERAIRLVQQVDEGLGCLLLVDMGSLASFAPEISLRTGVSVRCVARVDTLMALDAVNRASFRDKCTLDELADALEIGRLHAGFSDLEQRTGKPSAILTVCITGEGYARRIESFLKATVVECSDIKIVDVGLLNRDAMLARVEELRRDYDIVAAVGTINPELPGIPFLPMNYIFSGRGSMALTNLLEAHCQHNSGIGDLLDPQLILCDADFQDKNDALDTMCTMLMEKGCVKPEFLLSVYKRENLGVTCLPGHIAIPHGEPAYVTKPAICVAKICHPLDWAGGFVAEIVFLFALDEKCQGFVQNFCDIIKDENNVKELLSVKNAKEIYDFLK